MVITVEDNVKKRIGVTLKNVRDSKGKKTEDYVCTDCEKESPRPKIWNSSRNVIEIPETKEELEALSKAK